MRVCALCTIYWTSERIFCVWFGWTDDHRCICLSTKPYPFIALNFLWHIRIKSHFIMSGIFMLWFYFISFHFAFLFNPNRLCVMVKNKKQIYGWIATALGKKMPTFIWMWFVVGCWLLVEVPWHRQIRDLRLRFAQNQRCYYTILTHSLVKLTRMYNAWNASYKIRLALIWTGNSLLPIKCAPAMMFIVDASGFFFIYFSLHCWRVEQIAIYFNPLNAVEIEIGIK